MRRGKELLQPDGCQRRILRHLRSLHEVRVSITLNQAKPTAFYPPPSHAFLDGVVARVHDLTCARRFLI